MWRLWRTCNKPPKELLGALAHSVETPGLYPLLDHLAHYVDPVSIQILIKQLESPYCQNRISAVEAIQDMFSDDHEDVEENKAEVAKVLYQYRDITAKALAQTLDDDDEYFQEAVDKCTPLFIDDQQILDHYLSRLQYKLLTISQFRSSVREMRKCGERIRTISGVLKCVHDSDNKAYACGKVLAMKLSDQYRYPILINTDLQLLKLYNPYKALEHSCEHLEADIPQKLFGGPRMSVVRRNRVYADSLSSIGSVINEMRKSSKTLKKISIHAVELVIDYQDYDASNVSSASLKSIIQISLAPYGRALLGATRFNRICGIAVKAQKKLEK